jgi:beta-galactosidase
MELVVMIPGGAKTMEKYTNPGNKPYNYGFILEYVEK